MNNADRLDDTIVALATALGEAGIHILRLSGVRAREIVDQCFEPVKEKRWQDLENYTLHLGWFKEGGVVIDQVLVGRMLSPSSYTGEDVYEINCHGGPLVALRIMQVCLRLGARQAEAGEFTKRAFVNGKLDLVQAEAVVDLISARTEAGANLAVAQLEGKLSENILGLRELILETLAFIEAGIDFPEDDVEGLDRGQLEDRLVKAKQKAEELWQGSRSGRILREGLGTVIVGRPNAGKSSLLNALLKEERAIVTDIPGTTRDEIREYVNLGGILLQLVDTAGLRKSNDPIEKIGIQRSWEALERADLILLVTVAGEPLVEEEKEILASYGERVIVLVNKVDLLDDPSNPTSDFRSLTSSFGAVWLKFSVLKRWGFEELEEEIRQRVFQGRRIDPARPLLSNVRQIAALEKCLDALGQALAAVSEGYPWDLVSIDVRRSLEEISVITGHDVEESLIEDIFARFCIGK